MCSVRACARVCVMCVHMHVCVGWGWVGHVKTCFITIYNYSNSFTVHILLPHHINTCVHSTDPPTLSDLIEHVGSSCSTKWYNLGLRLGVNTHTLDQIEEDCQRKSNEACRKMFQAWLREKRSGTWNDVISALNSRSVNEGGVAEELEEIIST